MFARLMPAGESKGDLLVDEPHVLDYKEAYLLTAYVSTYGNKE